MVIGSRIITPVALSASAEHSPRSRVFDPEQIHQPGGYEPEPDVFDTWFTSSLTPQIVARWGDANDGEYFAGHRF